MGSAARQQPGNFPSAARDSILTGLRRIETIQSIAVASYADGDYFTLKDGTHSVKFEPRAKAQTSVVMKALASLANNQTLSVNDGTHAAVVYEAEKIPNAYATGSITCPIASKFADNETVTLNDGVHTAKVIEFQRTANAYAAGSIVCPAKSAFLDNEQVVLDDGVHTAKHIEFQVTPNAYAAGSITAIAKSLIKNNETFVLADGTHTVTFIFHVAAAAAATGSIVCVTKANTRNNETVTIGDGTNTVVFSFNVGAAANAATGSITEVTKANHVDGETVTIGDGTHTVVFEYDTNGSVSGGNVKVDISACTTAESVALKLASVINDVTTGLTVSATDVAAGVITLTADSEDYDHNVTITHTVAHGGYSVSGMTGGVTAYSAGATTEVDISGQTTAAQVATVLYGVINGVVGGLTVTATDPAGSATIPLTADTSDYTHNVVITETVANAGFTATGMSGGVTAFAAGGNTEVDITGASTAAQVATVIYSTINGVVAGLTITATDPAGSATVPLTNDNVGDFNTTITDTVANGDFTHTGMGGGSIFHPTGGAVVVCDISAVSAAADVAAALKTAINTATTLDITAGTITGSTIPLTNDTYGAYNAAITDTVTSDLFTHTGMSGGAVFTPAGGAVVVCNISGVSSAADVAAALKTSINTATTLDITAGTITVATIALTNDTYGAYNATIADTVTDSGFTHTGMSGGTVFVSAGGGVIVVDISAATTDEQAAQAFADAINVSEGSSDLNLTAGTAASSAFILTADATKSATVTVSGTAMSSTATISAGLGGVAVSGAVEVDMTGLSTAAQGAGKIAQVANALGVATLAMTCAATTGGAFTTTLTTAGSFANDTPSTENVTNGSFIVTATRAGANPISPDGFASLGDDGYLDSDELGPGGKLAGDRVAPASGTAAGTESIAHFNKTEAAALASFQALDAIASKAAPIANLSNTNRGDETKTTIATKTGITEAQMDLVALGAKATVAVTMNGFGTWADGQTIVLPTIGSHTLKVTSSGDIDIVGLGEAAAKAAIVSYLNAHAGATVAVTIVGTSTTMTVTALAYGATLNGSAVSGTMLTSAGTMDGGAAAVSTIANSAFCFDTTNKRIGIGTAAATFARTDTKLEVHSPAQPLGNGAIMLLRDTTLSAAMSFPTDAGLTIYVNDSADAAQQVASFFAGWCDANNSASSETYAAIHANNYGATTNVSICCYGRSGVAMFVPAATGMSGTNYGPGADILGVYGGIVTATRKADITSMAAGTAGCIGAFNPAGNSRFDFGQDQTHGGVLAWLYNATPNNGYMVLSSTNAACKLVLQTAAAAVLVGSATDDGTGAKFQVTGAISASAGIVNAVGSIVCQAGALATTATDGFLYIPTCAGPPTGVPTAKTGTVPIVYDSVGNKFYVGNGGWKGSTAPGVWS